MIEVVEHQRPSVHAARAGMMGMKATYTFRFHKDGTGTRVEMIADIVCNFLWWPFLGKLARMMDKDDGEYLNRLKEAMAKQSAL